MRTYIVQAAAEDLLAAIRDSYFGGLCSWSETASRLAALSALSGPGQESQVAHRVLAIGGFPLDVHWRDEAPYIQGNERNGDYEGLPETLVIISHPSGRGEDGPPILQLIPAHSTGLSGWHFHQFDPDFYPSIPHGHWKGRKQPKLDPYTGWIYEGSDQRSREKRERIVALWNDLKFRHFARSAIDYYLGAFPSYRGWRVKDPRRLPRRR